MYLFVTDFCSSDVSGFSAHQRPSSTTVRTDVIVTTAVSRGAIDDRDECAEGLYDDNAVAHQRGECNRCDDNSRSVLFGDFLCSDSNESSDCCSSSVCGNLGQYSYQVGCDACVYAENHQLARYVRNHGDDGEAYHGEDKACLVSK